LGCGPIKAQAQADPGTIALKAEFLKQALGNTRLPKNASSSIIAGPKVTPSAKDVD